MKRFPKKRNQRYHAEIRSFQRFGFVIDVDEAIRDIQQGRAKFLFRQSNRVTAWEISQKGERIVVIYDKMRKMIVTTLPKEALEIKRNMEYEGQ